MATLSQPEIMLTLLRQNQRVDSDLLRRTYNIANVPDTVYRLRGMGFAIDVFKITKGTRKVCAYALNNAKSAKDAKFIKGRK